MSDFKTWWHNEGSGIRPAAGEDTEEFAKRITSIAWSNGEYVQRERCQCSEPEDDDEDEICSACSGSGEGMYDGSRCYKCKGCGVEPVEKDEDL